MQTSPGNYPFHQIWNSMKKINIGYINAALMMAAIAAGITAFFYFIKTAIDLLHIFAPAGIFLIAIAIFALFSAAIFTFSIRVKVDEKCISCENGMPLNSCPESERKGCGHHCNCSWIHDECCWCGQEFGVENLPEL